ncbi:E3 ubiquitin-protein ligase ZNF598 [Glossina fuscipes]|uniref:RING-type E3 ubiquitin transferase n=1 Tax=Glossina fuscipes TaxID=7396 RepID=A0A9C6DQ08_9MUSC|nr:E3 ubiquitin-protein ligase ZNF598 [Glossina fuscipes]KAI9583528.1 hypothetical protein GQX74_005276 [Glossina fuscipes]
MNNSNQITRGDVKNSNSSQLLGSVTTDDNACVVCFKNVDIYSIGECDHPVCYECSTRMRVLCQQNECPICRQVLSKVIFTYDKLPYRELEAKNRSEYYSKKYKIGFYTCEIQQKFFELLDHPCPKCNVPPYRTFQGLRNHVRKEHDLYFCDICVEHLKIFTFERRCYTHAELDMHRIKGDTDNRSHRGHPLCEYCNKRYLDRDELFRHLRREHYFCHFCDADGCNEFYRDYTALAVHFRQDHYLCEEGKCATEEFTGAFRSEIDYKAHVANVHGKSMNKQQAKQTRTLQLEITLGPRSSGRSGQMEQNVANMKSRGNNGAVSHESETTLIHHNNSQQQQRIDPCNEEEFPSLAGASSASNVSLTRPPPPSMFNRSRMSGLARTKENFPALCGNASNAARTQQNTLPISSMLRKQPTPATGAIPRTTTPTNVPSTNNNGSSMVIHVSNRPNITAASTNKKPFTIDFPALPSGKMKKQTGGAKPLVDEDVAIPGVQVPTGVVSAKHRTLMDGYVSVANPTNFQKIQMVQKDDLDSNARKELEAKNVPKLTNQDFPSLSGTTSVQLTQSATWVKAAFNDKRQKDVENRKNKIAAAPILQKSLSNTSQNILIDNNGKKEKKSKEKKTKERNNNNENKNINNINLANGEKLNTNQTALRLPPGFGNQNESIKPPPGFQGNVIVNSVAKSPNNLTFTSSLGESYSILATHSYTPPPEALQRNQKLVGYFKETLKTPEALEEFRHISQKFREGTYKTQAYYEHCQAALKDKFDNVFPELLVLLPDISKQQALYLVHKQQLNTLSPVQCKALPKLHVCVTCKQVLSHNDLDIHRKMHELKENFPQLNGSLKKSHAAAVAAATATKTQ